MWGPIRPSVKLHEGYRLYVSRLSFKPATPLPLGLLACTGLIVAGYFLSLPGMDAVISAVNRTIGILLLLGYILLLMRARAPDEWLSTAQENLHPSEAQFRVMADVAFPLTPLHHTYFSTLLLKQGTT